MTANGLEPSLGKVAVKAAAAAGAAPCKAAAATAAHERTPTPARRRRASAAPEVRPGSAAPHAKTVAHTAEDVAPLTALYRPAGHAVQPVVPVTRSL
jgi:hypothetical protein